MTLGTALPRRDHARGRSLASRRSSFWSCSSWAGWSSASSPTPATTGRSTAPGTRRPSDSSAVPAVHLNGTSAVRITVGPERSVVVHADDNLVERVTTEVDAGVLHVDARKLT